PDSSLPRDRTGYSGRWEGAFEVGSEKVSHVLVVEEVTVDGAVVVFAMSQIAGEDPAWGRYRARCEEGGLKVVDPGGVLKRTDLGTLAGSKKGAAVYRLQPDGTLFVWLEAGGLRLQTTLSRAK